MTYFKKTPISSALMVLFISALGIPAANAAIFVQCPGDNDGDAAWNSPGEVQPPNVKCMHVSSGDGLTTMADGRMAYTFGFGDLTGKVDEANALAYGQLAAEWPAPAIEVDQGDEFYLSLSNMGMAIRSDLFDPHTVHFHGFPNATSVMDGVPDVGISVNGGATLTYYYNVVTEGTFIWHCHVEATEHMQMGMIGNLWVNAAQNKLPDGTDLNGFTHHTGYQYAYNDGDGSTFYDVDFPVQLGGFDMNFHTQHFNVQPLPFADMHDDYMMINGRGYPDTVDVSDPLGLPPDAEWQNVPYTPRRSQKVSTLIEANAGQKVLLRLTNINITHTDTIMALGLPPLKMVARDASILRDENGNNISVETSAVTIGPGETMDLILDTTGVAPGTYFLYSTAYQYLSNGEEDFGGMMTEIHIN